MELLYFIFGILFIEIIVPILDAIMNIFLAWTESRKTKYSEIVAESNIKVKQTLSSSLQEPQPQTPKRQIGFVVKENEEELS